MFEHLRKSLQSTLGAVRDSAPADSRTRRTRKPRVESLEGRAMCDGSSATFNNGPGASTSGTIVFTG